ncbi:MAG: metal-dependent hydrolase [Rhodospirillales bacterium]|nr:metal-dependent hydrolase [Rhodospirillales bacterium]
MDSVTQFALGAAVGAAALGPRIGMRKAALIGGLYGTVPDLDTFLPSPDPVTSFTSHRGASHSLVIQLLAAPLFAEPLVRVFRGLNDKRLFTYVAVYLMFATHALIDAMTVYGTRLFWPLYEGPVGVGSIFIIDPLYTLPLLLVTLWAILLNPVSSRFRGWLTGALVVSTLYMLGTAGLQQIANARAATWLAARGIEADRTLSIPTPFNTLYWRTIVIDGSRYLNVYQPLIGDDVTVYAHSRHPELEGCLADTPAYRDLVAFTKGFYRMEEKDGKIIFSDLRMGLTPNYVFRFKLGETENGVPNAVPSPTREPTIRGTVGDIDWLLAGIAGAQTVRDAEKHAYLPQPDEMLAVIPKKSGLCG